MLQATKLTFGSVWGWLGIIVGAISLINLGVMYFEVGVGPVLERVVATYKAIVHTGFDYLLFWIDWKMPVWLKDTVTIYVVFAGAAMRASPDHLAEAPGFGNDLARALVWPISIWFSRRNQFHARRILGDYVEGQVQRPDEERIASADQAWFSLTLNLVLVPVLAITFVVISAGV